MAICGKGIDRGSGPDPDRPPDPEKPRGRHRTIGDRSEVEQAEGQLTDGKALDSPDDAGDCEDE